MLAYLKKKKKTAFLPNMRVCFNLYFSGDVRLLCRFLHISGILEVSIYKNGEYYTGRLENDLRGC